MVATMQVSMLLNESSLHHIIMTQQPRDMCHLQLPQHSIITTSASGYVTYLIFKDLSFGDVVTAIRSTMWHNLVPYDPRLPHHFSLESMPCVSHQLVLFSTSGSRNLSQPLIGFMDFLGGHDVITGEILPFLVATWRPPDFGKFFRKVSSLALLVKIS